MRRKSRISFGPGAASLILIVVILSMSVLGMLSLMNSRNDRRLTQRSTEVIRAGYVLNDLAERSLASLDSSVAAYAALAKNDEDYVTAVTASLPAGMSISDRIISWSETDGARTLECAVELMPLNSDTRLSWRTHRLTAVTEEIWSSDDSWNPGSFGNSEVIWN